jgi:protein gp37
MSDLFHEDVPLEYIQRCFNVMQQASQHTFQVLTKRADRLAELAGELPWPSNVWMETSVENTDYVHRVRELATVPVAVRFLSVEPLLGPIPRLLLSKINWVSWAANRAPVLGPCKKSGSPKSATVVCVTRCRFSLSNGAG